MIPHIQTKQSSWQRQLRDAVTEVDILLSHLSLAPNDLGLDQQQPFPLRVPWSFVDRMNKGDPNDPLLLQILPSSKEWQTTPGFSNDPLGEKNTNPVPGLLHKYHGRVLLTVAGACAVNCRYCFRRHFPYQENNPGREGWQRCLDYIKQNSSISEVIFSGGDPLLASDEHLSQLVKNIAKIEHISTIRIHTRLPIVIPERINQKFIDAIRHPRLKFVMAIHCNHPNELDLSVKQALNQLKSADFTLLNQSVLLKGINDHSDVLKKLSEQLFDYGVLPYYLHLMDKVQGAAHFDVNEASAKIIWQELVAKLPGYLVPKLVKEQADQPNKIPI